MAAHVNGHGKVNLRERQTYVPSFEEPAGWKADAQRDLEYSAWIHRHHDGCLFMSEQLGSFESLSAIGEKHRASTLASLRYLVDAIRNDGCIDVPAFDPSILQLVSQLPSAPRWIRYMRLVAEAESLFLTLLRSAHALRSFLQFGLVRAPAQHGGRFLSNIRVTRQPVLVD